MAGISYGDGATKRTITGVSYQDGVTKRLIKAAWYGDGATKRQVFSSYTPINNVSANPTSPTGTQTVVEPPTGPATMTVTTGTVVITWDGGSGGSVTWSKISGDTMTVSGTSSATFSATVSKNAQKNAVYRATVSDGTSSDHVDVTVTLFYNAIS